MITFGHLFTVNDWIINCYSQVVQKNSVVKSEQPIRGSPCTSTITRGGTGGCYPNPGTAILKSVGSQGPCCPRTSLGWSRGQGLLPPSWHPVSKRVSPQGPCSRTILVAPGVVYPHPGTPVSKRVSPRVPRSPRTTLG